MQDLRAHAEPWFPFAPEAAETLLFCFPFAGGTAAFYRPWMAPAAQRGLALLPVELPGHGLRRAEAPFTEARALVAALAPALRARLDRPFALFGHSLGALIAFETARLLRDRYALSPALLAVSGRQPPDRDIHPARRRHALPFPALCAALDGLGGTAPEILAHPQLMRLVEPVLRADFAMTELHRHVPGTPLEAPMLALTGTEDEEVSLEEMAGWSHQAGGSFRLATFPGTHFYLSEDPAAVLDAIVQALPDHLPRRAFLPALDPGCAPHRAGAAGAAG